MKQIQLGRGFVALVDDVDFEVLSVESWRAQVHGNHQTRRVYAVHDARRMHRIVWERAHGPVPHGLEIDHVHPGELGGLDNRRDNLRLCTKQQNQANRRISRNNTSGFKGVWWQKQARRWRVDVTVNGKKSHVGYFARTNFQQGAA